MYENNGPDLGEARRKRTAVDIEPLFTEDPAPKVPAHPLDDERSCELHNRLIHLYHQELNRQEENRREMAQDEDFYDGKQWNDEDAAAVRERGQIPLVYNVLSTTFDWLTGTERRMRTDFKVLPRRKDSGRAAERKTQLLKYLADVNRTQYSTSRAFSDAAKVGVGWIEDGVQDDSEGEPIYTRYESWRNILWDSAATERDLSDARYIFRSRWVDEDIAVAMFKDRAGTIKAAIDEGNPRGHALDEDADEPMDALEDELDGRYGRGVFDPSHARRRVRLIEAWYRVPVETERLRGSQFSGDIYDASHPGHAEAVKEGAAEVRKGVAYRVHVAIMTTGGLLYASMSPYRHNMFPFTPIWGKIRGRDNMPYGFIRPQKDIQVDINKRAAKALHILSTNKVVMDEGAVDDLDEFAEEVARNDAILVKKKGFQLELNADRQLAPAHLEMMSRSIAMLQTQGGVTDENMGRRTNATSGIAIERRQDQGSLATSGYFDNLRFAAQIMGEKRLSLIEQYFTEAKSFRITNQRGTPQYIDINDGLPENDITRTKADFVISEDAWNATRRQAEVQEMMALLNQLAPVAPQVVLATLDIVFESMDLPSREELVKRIRAITGQRDPDAEEPTPEEIQQAQAQAAQQEMQQRAFMADVADKEASAALKAAQAKKAQGDMELVLATLAGKNVESQRAALEAALTALATPPAAPVADAILRESGFVSRSEQEEDARQTGIMEGEAAQAQQAMAEQAAAEQQAMAAQEEEAMRAAQQREKDKAEVDPLQREAMKQEERAARQAEQQQQPQA